MSHYCERCGSQGSETTHVCPMVPSVLSVGSVIPASGHPNIQGTFRIMGVREVCPTCAAKDAELAEKRGLVRDLTTCLEQRNAEIARLTGLVKGGPCETCANHLTSVDSPPRDYCALTLSGEDDYLCCAAFGGGCYAHEPKEDSDART